MRPYILIYLLVSVLMQRVRASSSMVDEADDGNLPFGDELVNPGMDSDELIDPMREPGKLVDPMMEPDECVDSIMGPDSLVDSVLDLDDIVDPTIGLDPLINLDEDLDLVANAREYCDSSSEGSELWMSKIRGRGESCNALKSTPPPPRLKIPQLQLPEEPEFQNPSLGGSSIPSPYIRYPQCYGKEPFCCPSGRGPDNTWPGCKICENATFFSYG